MRARPRLAAFVAAAALAAAAGLPALGEEPTLQFGVVSFYNPRLMYLKYQPLVDYLSEATGKRWELAVSAAYDRTVAELCAGRLAAAYLGPFTYLRAHELCGAEPVVRLQTGGQGTYRSLILVREDSGITTLAGLRGRRVAFGAPLSTSSHLLPRVMLMRAGLTPGIDVYCDYLWHHERAARAVLLGEDDACAVRDIVGEKFNHRGLRVIAASEPITNFPFVVAPVSDGAVGDRLLRALVTLPRADGSVAQRIAGWDEELASGFSPVTDSEYDGLRLIAREAFGPAALSLPEAALACPGERP